MLSAMASTEFSVASRTATKICTKRSRSPPPGKVKVITETYALDEIATAYERVPGYTVWSGLRWAEPLPGGRVAVVGNGGLGHLAIQYAKAAGFVMCTASATSRGLSEGSR
jgi:hypothetical protein